MKPLASRDGATLFAVVTLVVTVVAPGGARRRIRAVPARPIRFAPGRRSASTAITRAA